MSMIDESICLTVHPLGLESQYWSIGSSIYTLMLFEEETSSHQDYDRMYFVGLYVVVVDVRRDFAENGIRSSVVQISDEKIKLFQSQKLT